MLWRPPLVFEPQRADQLLHELSRALARTEGAEQQHYRRYGTQRGSVTWRAGSGDCDATSGTLEKVEI